MSVPTTIEAAQALRGAELIQSFIRRLPNEPGVYRMLDERGELLYVGKAKSLKKRVVAYTRPAVLPARLQRMIALTRHMEFVTTRSEVEALLLEANLIKQHRPGFNIVLRDDKSFPSIVIRLDHDFPLIGKHRGAKRANTEQFGPFASAGAVNDTLNTLLKAFPLRSCRDSIFATRIRPCLQHQIKRCSAPCVGRIGKEEYAKLVDEVRGFLNGRSSEVQARLQAEMAEAAQALQFERAAGLRDRIKAMAHIHAKQGINVDSVDDADVIAAHAEGGQVCVQVFFYRHGQNHGNSPFYPAHAKEASTAETLAAFLAQFYAERRAPGLVLLAEAVPEQELIAEALTTHAGRKVQLLVPQRGEKRTLVENAATNARQALARRLADTATQENLLEQLTERFDLPSTPARIEVYDNSHIQGTNAIGAFIVAGGQGFDRKSYRTFNIKGDEITPGDDYGMMREVLKRRFARLLREDPDRASGTWPDLVVIDGGPGQLTAAQEAMADEGLVDVPLMAVAKGPERNAGRERFFLPGREPLELEARDPVLYFVQRLRDEAHRFAINTHRGKRARAIGQSVLDTIPGIGAKRKKALLSHFGSARGVGQAGLLDLERVPGINKATAQLVYDHFHDGG